MLKYALNTKNQRHKINLSYIHFMEKEENNYVIIPIEAIKEDSLVALLQEFVLREGTDYGAHELSLEQKTQKLRKQLENKEASIVFDQKSESVTILLNSDLDKIFIKNEVH